MKTLTTILLILSIFISYGQIAEDKKLHFKYGAAIGAVVNLGIVSISKDKEKGGKTAKWLAPAIAFMVGIGKEYVYDKNNGGTVDFMDAVYTGGGGFVGSYTITFFTTRKKKTIF